LIDQKSKLAAAIRYGLSLEGLTRFSGDGRIQARQQQPSNAPSIPSRSTETAIVIGAAAIDARLVRDISSILGSTNL
jgi:hypothetical protein